MLIAVRLLLQFVDGLLVFLQLLLEDISFFRNLTTFLLQLLLQLGFLLPQLLNLTLQILLCLRLLL